MYQVRKCSGPAEMDRKNDGQKQRVRSDLFCITQIDFTVFSPILVTALNEAHFANCDVITKPLYCHKIESDIGYIQVSVKPNSQVHHGFYREIKGDQVSKIGLFYEGQPIGIYWQRLEGNLLMVLCNA